MKLIYVIILLVVGSFSQNASDMERLSKDVDDLGSELKKFSRTYSDGYSGGVTLNEAQLEEVRAMWLAQFNLVAEVAGCGEYVSDAEVVFVQPKIDQQVFVLLEYLLRTDDGTVFYYRNKPANIQRIKDVILLLKPETE